MADISALTHQNTPLLSKVSGRGEVKTRDSEIPHKLPERLKQNLKERRLKERRRKKVKSHLLELRTEGDRRNNPGLGHVDISV
jgi:hypothetical protein